ncbi:segregation and condensation protein A [Mycoplasmopsis canis UFG4]|uniref:Segregation and condensation protein A n=2 Tax=Mycoplasmopsis canis TaxID=29555 RepID=I1A7D4_9BACT|nr:segregation/condensation protein A [Mycoplasmopsis canis]AKF40885.1 aromatic-ring-hydroxylating dioxygenase [Mycoplasmopsis canis]AMD81007.1 segregation/condensation protein A [Mycoplasmopsis canis PG 14]EIE40982.1 segregation and condensation protein A [Mycoplasmopsis canis PG 14]EIE41059.1 segregation and condensation protein A [Mycoplasmopsis canis UF31]EIE42322.1 segregation and condensation protein A [Mycoplasmopsis canis UFG1]
MAKKQTIDYSSDYVFRINEFDGPLDLLLSLIKEKKIDIMDVNLIELANQYIEIINKIKESEIDIAGDYLLMASTLINLKAKMILQEPDNIDEEVEEEKKVFLQDLIEYQQFKNIQSALKTFQDNRNNIYIKKQSDILEFIQDNNDTKLDGHSNPMTLITTLRRMFERVYAKELRKTKLEKFNITPSEMFPFIKGLLAQKERVEFEEVFNQPTIQHFVITLIALLDLARQQYLIINQNEQFDTIYITRGEYYNEK